VVQQSPAFAGMLFLLSEAREISCETARIHHAYWRRGGVAARSACAAAGDAGAAGLAGPRLTALAGFRQGLNEIGPTIVLLTSWTCRSQTAHRNGRFVTQQTVENR
jgi:hypothetical protein